MTSDHRNRMAQHGSAIMACLFVCVLSFTADLVFRPSLPVMSWMMPTGAWEFTAHSAENVFSGLKVRSCKIIPNTQQGMAIIDGELVTKGIRVEWVDDDTPSSTFPAGVIFIGGVRWHLDDLANTQKLGVILSHQCDLRLVKSHFWYELPLPENRQ